MNLKKILDDYEEVSGRAIKYSKSGIFFSRNVNVELRGTLSNIIGVESPLNAGKYVGLPSLICREKREIFNYVKERIWKKLQGGRSYQRQARRF